jgi:hypothetical protein
MNKLEIQNSLNVLSENYPHLSELVKIIPPSLDVTNEFLEKYQSDIEGKNKVLQHLVGRYNKAGDGPLKDFYLKRRLQYLLANPKARLSDIRLGVTAARDLVPHVLRATSNLERISYYPFVFNYATFIHDNTDNEELKELSIEVLNYFVIDRVAVENFFHNSGSAISLTNFFPEKCPSLSNLNLVLYLSYFIPLIKEKIKAQDKIPAAIMNVMRLKRSIPSIHAFTDLLVLNYNGLSNRVSRVGDIARSITQNNPRFPNLKLLARNAIHSLEDYYFLRPDNAGLKLGGTYGTSFQFNVCRMIEKEIIECVEMRQDYMNIDPVRLKKFLRTRLVSSGFYLNEFIDDIAFQLEENQVIGVRDIVNIMVFSKYLEQQEMLSFDRSSKIHYSKKLPNVAQYSLGVEEYIPKGRAGGNKALPNKKYKLPSGKKIDEFESLLTKFNSCTIDIQFEAYWSEYSHGAEYDDIVKGVAYDVWVAVRA